MATRTPQEPLHHIKSAARKLPIKRKTNPNDPSEPLDDPPNPVAVHDAAEDHSGDSSDAGPGSVPFKFQRIWSEADEVRFLKGLLASHGQGLVFPRDLNVFFDRFSEPMLQPFTRSQLSEKLRRLRKKFRIASGRIARGMDVSALSGHDRELFELSTRLWNSEFADSSPFGVSGPDASKRRRRLPPPPPEFAKQVNVNAVPVILPAPGENGTDQEKPFVGRGNTSSGGSVKSMIMKAVLDVLDDTLKDVKISKTQHRDLARRWEEQRVLELDVLANRLRLVIEDAFRG